jgi:2'-5' RNA ligase
VTWRLFVAHPVPPAIREELAAQLAPYRRRHADVRWTRPESWHLTLLFVGAVRSQRAHELATLCDRLAHDADGPYEVRADRGGGRLRRADGVAWLGLGLGAERLLALARAAADGCPPDITDGVPPRQTPSAHLTVVRRAHEAVIGDLREQRLGPLGVAWTVERVELVRSQLGRGGASYETLHAATL